MQTKVQKEELIKSVAQKTKGAKAVVFANFRGVTVADLTGIRRELMKSGSSWQVLKKTLLNLALKDAGVKVDARELDGQVGIAYSSDEVAAAKVLADFVKAHKDTELKILGGALGGDALTGEQVKALAKLPSMQELRGQLVGTIQGPVAGFVRTLSGTIAGMVRVLGAVAESKKA
ncbi:MAG: 50S ribosomal protein L10 [Candidatus Moraniibacteriota bacterium]